MSCPTEMLLIIRLMSKEMYFLPFIMRTGSLTSSYSYSSQNV